MKEQKSGFQETLTMEQRFDNAHAYWQKAIDDGRAHKTEYYQQVFNSPETQLYREMANDEIIMIIARTMNTAWIELPPSYGRPDPNNS